MLISSNGGKYTGQFLEGLPNGYGVEEQTNGVRYFGSWSKGLKEGAGTVDFQMGLVIWVLSEMTRIEGKYNWGDGRITDSYRMSLVTGLIVKSSNLRANFEGCHKSGFFHDGNK